MKSPKMVRLTERENQMVDELMRGLAAKEIAVRNHVSQNTVETHIKNLRRKLGARNNVQAVVRFLSVVKDSGAYLRQLCVALLFTAIQGHVILTVNDIEIRRPSRTSLRGAAKTRTLWRK